MTWWVFILASLSVWRVANLLTKQNGPLAIFARLRAFLATKQKHTGGFYDMISCMSCSTMIVSIVTTLLLVGASQMFFLYVLSFSAIATLIDALIAKK